jgi:hypothetical protein
MYKFALISMAALFLLSACRAQVDTDQIATIVAATLQAGSPTQQPTLTAENLESQTGTVEGSICYPSEGIPPMTLYIQPLIGGDAVAVPIAQNQSTYSTQLAPGNYTAFAWLLDFSLGGSYSQAVACGLEAGCTDHTLIEFSVMAGTTTSGVDVCDWYGDFDSVPLPEVVEPPTPSTGSITGLLSYPSEFIPSLQIVLFDVNDSNQWLYLTTAENSNVYQFDGVPVGSYYVVAYVAGGDFGGGYTQAVSCGLSVDCTDHSLIPVVVSGGEVTNGVNPQDWYAPEGTFPLNPN